MAGDPRWNFWWTLGTLVSQFIFIIIVIALSSTSLSGNDYYTTSLISLVPLTTAILSLLSVLIYTPCFFGRKLHPLVVLTLSIELMILWLGTTIVHILSFVYYSSLLGCSGGSSSYGDGDGDDGFSSSYDDDAGSYYSYVTHQYYDSRSEWESSDAYAHAKAEWESRRNRTCGRSGALVAFVILCFLSYIFLVAFSAITRKRTKMPYVPGQNPLLRAAAPPPPPPTAGQDHTAAAPAPMMERRSASGSEAARASPSPSPAAAV